MLYEVITSIKGILLIVLVIVGYNVIDIINHISIARIIAYILSRKSFFVLKILKLFFFILLHLT